jgi:putative tricarboxylic transport membrane protein
MKKLFLIAVSCAISFSAVAQSRFKPSEPIELVVHAGPGGGADILARAVVGIIEKENLVPVRIRIANRTGGGGAIAASYLAKKKGSTHTIGLFTGVWLTNPMVYPENNVTISDLTPVVGLMTEPALIVVKADSPYRTIGELIDAAKRAPGQLSQAGGLITSRDNIVRQQLQKLTGAQWSFVVFTGGSERIAALLGGHVQLMVAETQEVSEYVRSGALRVLAHVNHKRTAIAPGAPTLKEAGFDVPVVPQFRGIVAPPGVPREALEYYEDLFLKLSKSAVWHQHLAENQWEDGYRKGPELISYIDDFNGRVRDILKTAGVKIVR